VIPGIVPDMTSSADDPAKRRWTMTKLRVIGVAALAFVMMAPNAMARGGGAVRGAVVGGMVGGSGGAATGAKVGLVTSATRAAINQEDQGRNQYYTTPEYQNATLSNFEQEPVEILGTTPTGPAKKTSTESVIRQNGKPLLGVTLPADWNVRTGDNYISGMSPDKHAYAMFVTKAGANKEAGVQKVKEGLGNYLKDIEFDDPSETKGGATVIAGSGKSKKTGADAAFAIGVFEADKGQFVGAAFVVDAKLEDHYKETIKGICETIRRAKDIAPGPT
jgi:hypothetical protein